MIDLPLSIKTGKKLRGNALNYVVREYLGRGGSGAVYKAECVETGADVALKFFLPLYQLNLSLFEATASRQKALRDLVDFHAKELKALRALRHPGIVQVLDSGIYHPTQRELAAELRMLETISFFTMEYIEGADIATFLANATVSRATVAAILVKLAEALVYLHEVKEYLHADIRASNVLIRKETADPVIIDFALYKNFNFAEVDPTDITKLHGDWDLFPKDLHTSDPLKRFKETEGQRGNLKQLCFPGLDLFQVGKLLRALVPLVERIFPAEDMQFFNLLADELQQWSHVRTLTAGDVRIQFEKLHPAYSQFMGVEELTPPTSARQTHQLPGRVITTSSLIDRIASTRSFRRLRSINQLALIDILYPGAGYKRHLHCLRAYGYCSELLESLAQSPRFRRLFCPELARQALVATILHDINHFPFLHIFQELEGEYMRDLDLLDLFCDGTATRDNPSVYELAAEAGLDRARFRDLLLLEHHKLAENGYDPGLQIIKSIIDSGADVDKLAYLYDDSLTTGVAYGRGVDSARLLSSVAVAQIPLYEGLASWHVAYREDGLPAVESLVMARYWMFRTVYWHRTNRAIMVMLMHVLRRLYVEARANAAEFVLETMWKSEEAVLEYLDEKYRQRFGEESITRWLIQDRRQVYHRLLSVQGGSPDAREATLAETLQNLTSERFEGWRANLIVGLREYLASSGIRVPVRPESVLIDVPRRRLDTSGAIFIIMETGKVRAIQDVPGPVQRVVTDFEKLAKRLRIFVEPSIGENLTPHMLVENRNALLKLAEDALPQEPTSQVR